MIHVADTWPKKEAALAFMAQRGVKLHRSEDLQALVRIGASGKIIGVVAYNGFYGGICGMHIAGDGNWISREFIRRTFDYPFNQLKLEAVVIPVPANNEKALKLDLHFGFKEVYRIKNGFARGVDLVVLEMRREDCRWLNEDAHELAQVA